MIEEFIQTIKENQSWMFTGYTRLISRFARTKLGTIWVLLANIFCITIFSFIYTKVFPSNNPSQYVVYMGVGFSLWTTLATILGSSTDILEYHKSDLLNSNKSPFFYICEEWYYQFINFAIGIVPIVFVLFIRNFFIIDINIGLGYPFKVIFSLLGFLISMASYVVIFSLVGVFLRDFKQLIPALLQLSFLTSPIMFPSSAIGNISKILYFNPLYTPVAFLRDTFIDPSFYNSNSIIVYLIFLTINVIISYFTLKLFWKLKNEIIYSA